MKVIGFVLFALPLGSGYVDLTAPLAVQKAVTKWADECGVNRRLAFAVAWAESGYDYNAVHKNKHSEDRGLFQLNSDYFTPETGDPFDPSWNAHAALAYLSALVSAFGDIEKAVAAFNCGASAVRREQIPESTKAYVKRVMERMGRE